MANAVAKYIAGTATQGGADAFVEVEIATDLIPADGYAFEIDHVDFEIGSDISAIGADHRIAVALSRDAQLAMPVLSAVECYYKRMMNWSLTTSGCWFNDSTWTWTPPAGIFLVEPSTWFQLDSDSTAIALTVYVRIWYKEVKLTEVEILRLLSNA